MELYINMKQPGKRARRVKPVLFVYDRVPETAEELIEATVRIMVEEFRKRQKQTLEERIPEAMEEERIAALAEIGRISFGYVYNEKEADPEKAVETAKLAYADGLVRVFIGEEEAEYRKEGTPVSLKDGDTVTFVRFAMLAGRMW